jgi:hypothetical protein
MTFDLTPDLIAHRTRAAAAAAEWLTPAAAAIDASATIPPPVLEALATLDVWGAGEVAAVLMVEELASISASAAAQAALAGDGAEAGLAGLRGVLTVKTPERRHFLALAAVCLGIGRAALGEALAAARTRGDRPGGEPADPPHWALADAATEIDGARLLVHAAAAGRGLPPSAVLVYASAAATRAVDAAVRIVGAEGYRPGGLLERCARDGRAASLVLGTEDDIRRRAADALLA